MPKRVKKVKKVKKQKQRQKQRVSVKIGNIGTGGGYGGGGSTIVIQQPPVQPQPFQPMQYIPPIHGGPIGRGGGGGGSTWYDDGGGGGFGRPVTFEDDTMSFRSSQPSSFSRLSELSPDSVNLSNGTLIPEDVFAAVRPAPIIIPPRGTERAAEPKRFPAGGGNNATRPPKLGDDRLKGESILLPIPIGEREPVSQIGIRNLRPENRMPVGEPMGLQPIPEKIRDTQSAGLGGKKGSLTVLDAPMVDLTKTTTANDTPMVPLFLGQPKPRRVPKPTERAWSVLPGPGGGGGGGPSVKSEEEVPSFLPAPGGVEESKQTEVPSLMGTQFAPAGSSRGGGLGALPMLPQPISMERPNRLASLKDLVESRPTLPAAPQTYTNPEWVKARVIEPLKLKRKEREAETAGGLPEPPPPPPTNWGVPNVPRPMWEAPPTSVREIGPQLPPGNVERSALFAAPRAVVMQRSTKPEKKQKKD